MGREAGSRSCLPALAPGSCGRNRWCLRIQTAPGSVTRAQRSPVSTLSPGCLHLKGSGCIRSVFQAVRRAGCLPSQVSELGAGWDGLEHQVPTPSVHVACMSPGKEPGKRPDFPLASAQRLTTWCG